MPGYACGQTVWFLHWDSTLSILPLIASGHFDEESAAPRRNKDRPAYICLHHCGLYKYPEPGLVDLPDMSIPISDTAATKAKIKELHQNRMRTLIREASLCLMEYAEEEKNP